MCIVVEEIKSLLVAGNIIQIPKTDLMFIEYQLGVCVFFLCCIQHYELGINRIGI